MEVYWMLLVVLVLTELCQASVIKKQNTESTKGGDEKIDIRMPGVHPSKDDEYWCYAHHVTQGPKYITQFEALAKGNVAHHILIYGCQEPATYDKAWPCGQLCSKGQSKILFAWARNAPPTHYPKDVGYKIGGDSDVNYIILQIHYRYGFKASDTPDHSGMEISLTDTAPQFKAGVMIMLATDLKIPSHAPKVSANMSCQYNDVTPIHPFAFRTHAHSLSTVISGYHYNATWELLGKGNPQWPQAFYPMTEPHTIKPGDYLVSQCTYDASKMEVDTYIGSTHNDEMCNFYMMYYTDSAKGKSYLECYDDHFPKLSQRMPAGSDVPPPRNQALEDIAEGHTHTHQHHTEQPTHTDTVLPSLQAVSVVNGWPIIKPADKIVLGQVGGMATDSKGNIHVFHRGSRVWDQNSFNSVNKFTGSSPVKENTLLTFDAAGNLIDQWGSGMFYMPHGLFIDHLDNLWVTDVALHQVMRFPKDSHKADMTLGKKMTPGIGDDQFCKPSDVVVLESGEFFVTDGYCNARIMKFSKDGKLMKKWGGPSKTVLADGFPPTGTFAIPHSIVHVTKHKTLCVADRENGRIQCFDYEGTFVKQIHVPEFGARLFAVTYCPDIDVLHAVNGPSLYGKGVKVQGFTIDYNKGTLLESWGPENGFTAPHEIIVTNDGKDLFVGEIGPNKIWKFKVNISTSQAEVSHQAQKRPGTHPQSVDSSSDEITEQKIEKSEEPDFGVSIVIGALLIIPVLVIIIIVVFLRVRKRFNFSLSSLSDYKQKNRRFNLGEFFGRRHKGFDPLNTDDNGELDHLNSDSDDVEEYSATSSHKA